MINKESNFKSRKITPEERKQLFWQKVVEEGDHSPVRVSYMVALLMYNVDELRKSIEEGSNVSNYLSKAIKNLTWALVIIGAITIGLLIISFLKQ